MYARVATVQLKPGVADEMIARGQQLLPQVGGVKGFRGAYALLDRQTNEAMTIALFDTEENARAYGETNVRAQVMQLLGQMAEGEPKISMYEVVLQS